MDQQSGNEDSAGEFYLLYRVYFVNEVVGICK